MEPKSEKYSQLNEDNELNLGGTYEHLTSKEQIEASGSAVIRSSLAENPSYEDDGTVDKYQQLHPAVTAQQQDDGELQAIDDGNGNIYMLVLLLF